MTPAVQPDKELVHLTDQQLLELLSEADVRIARLQHEVRRRMQSHAQSEHRAEQSAEISKMIEHLDQTTVDWQKVREFFRDSILEAQNPWNS